MHPTLSPADPAGTPFVDEARLLRDVAGYLPAQESEHIAQALEYAHQLLASQSNGHAALDGAQPPQAPADGVRTAARGAAPGAPHGARPGRSDARSRWDFEYVIAVAQTLAETVHIDAVSLRAVLLYPTVEGGWAKARGLWRVKARRRPQSATMMLLGKARWGRRRWPRQHRPGRSKSAWPMRRKPARSTRRSPAGWVWAAWKASSKILHSPCSNLQSIGGSPRPWRQRNINPARICPPSPPFSGSKQPSP